MGRTKKVEYEELRERILAAAKNMVRYQGTAALSIRKLAAEIGCAVGTIYNVFSNIDEIILTINSATLAKLQARLLNDTCSEDDALTACIRLSRSYVAFCQEEYHLWSLLIEYRLAPGNTLPAWYQQQVDELFLLVSRMAEPLTGGEKKKAERVARVLWAGLQGICSLAVSGKLDAVHAEPADVLAESLARNYARGLLLEQTTARR